MVQNAIDAEIAACDALSLQATQAGAQAFARLLTLAETRDSGQIPRIARFLAATYNGHAFPSCSDQHDENSAKSCIMRSGLRRRQDARSMLRSGCRTAASHSHRACRNCIRAAGGR